MDGSINVLVLVKTETNEKYFFLYTDDNQAECLRQIERFAANPELSMTWYDAVMLSDRVRKGLVERR